MEKFIAKPTVIKAVQFTNDSPETLVKINEILEPVRISYKRYNHPVILVEQEDSSFITAEINDYIMKYPDGKIGVCSEKLFMELYIQVI